MPTLYENFDFKLLDDADFREDCDARIEIMSGSGNNIVRNSFGIRRRARPAISVFLPRRRDGIRSTGLHLIRLGLAKLTSLNIARNWAWAYNPLYGPTEFAQAVR